MKASARRILLAAIAALPAALAVPAAAQDHGGHRSPEGALKAGDAAPDFTLKSVGGEGRTVSLSSFKGKQPVVLVFGSFT